nr:chloride channel protein [Candidatus Delongbacteria bacterium]
MKPIKSIIRQLPGLKSLFDYLESSEFILLGTLAGFIGLSGAIGVWIFKSMIHGFEHINFGIMGAWLQQHSIGLVVLIPVAGGLLVGGLKSWLIGVEKYRGVAGIMEAIAWGGGRLKYKLIPSKTVISALSIGSGASVGPEDPSVQIGSNLGSMIGQWLNYSEERIQSLVAAGAAGGVAAAFNAPIAGVFFAMEVLLGELSSRAFGIIVIASVISAAFTQAVSGTQPAFQLTNFTFHSARELPFYLILGLLSGLVAAAYIYILFKSQELFNRINIPIWCKPALAGLAVGLAGIWFPDLLGIGYGGIERILQFYYFPLSLVIILLIGKLILTPICISGGFMGGVFAPSLFLGAMTGGLCGYLLHYVYPSLPVAISAFAMIGMAAVLAGTIHAPLTAIILLFEMTNDYRIILPVMFTVVISLLVSQHFQKNSVYTMALAKKGLRIVRGKDIEIMETIHVKDIMQTDFRVLQENETIQMVRSKMERLHLYALPVVSATNRLIGIVTLRDIDRIERDHDPIITPIGVVSRKKLVTITPDQTIGSAMRIMGNKDINRLPVVESENSDRIVGWLPHTDLVRAYQMALQRRIRTQHQTQQARLEIIGGVEVIEEELLPNSPCIGRSVKEIAWPRDCVISSIRRGSEIILPHGNTILRQGDVMA